MIFSTTLLPAHADDWPHWRGIERNDRVAEDSGWEQGGWPPKARWSANVGQGSSSPLVVAGRVYALGWKDGSDRLVCLDAQAGKPLWSREYACPQYGRKSTGDKGIYSGPSATPEFDPATGYLYTLSIDGDLQAWDTRDAGRTVWKLNLYDKYDAPQRPRVGRSGRRDYGYTTAPLVWRDWVIVEVGASQGNLMAFSKSTGEPRWASECKDPAGHTGGLVPMVVEGVDCLAVLTHFHLVVARLDAGNEGRTAASYEWLTSFANNIATPVAHEDSVLITSGYNQNAICRLKIQLGGATKMWETQEASKVCSPVIADGHVYWAWRKLRCLDLATGEQRWEGGDFGDPGSCIVTSDRRLIAWGKRGKLVLCETAARSPQVYRELACVNVMSKADAWPHAVLSDGQLFLRDRQGNLQCLALRSSAAK